MDLFFVGALLLLVFGLASTSGSSSSGPGRVLQRENARGVHQDLQGLLDEWERVGTHQVLIPSSPWGGLRTSEADQASYAGDGYSAAATLRATPHGRGGGLDVWPVGFEHYVNGTWQAVPAELKQRFTDFGVFAELNGFVWGGRWRSASYPNGDQPHVELRNWRSLPFPPPPGGYS